MLSLPVRWTNYLSMTHLSALWYCPPSCPKIEAKLGLNSILRSNYVTEVLPVLFEFSLNDFPWIQRIQWIMTKSKSSMVTRDITHLPIDTLPVLVIQHVFSLLPLGRYLLLLTTLNRYQPAGSSGKLLFTTISRNVSICRYRISLVTILLLDLVMIHWIRWIQRKSFRENSNAFYLDQVTFLRLGSAAIQYQKDNRLSVLYYLPARNRKRNVPLSQLWDYCSRVKLCTVHFWREQNIFPLTVT